MSTERDDRDEAEWAHVGEYMRQHFGEQTLEMIAVETEPDEEAALAEYMRRHFAVGVRTD